MKRLILMVSLGLFPRLLAAQELDISALLGKTWYGVYMSGQKSGYAVNDVAKNGDGSVTVSEDARFHITMENVKQDMRIFSERVYAQDGALSQVKTRVETLSGESQFDAVVRGDSLLMRSVVGGEALEVELPRPKESLQDAFKQIELIHKGGEIGSELHYSIFEPMYRKEIDGISKVIAIEERVFDGVPTKVYKIKNTLVDMGIDSISYVAEDGTTLEDEVAGLITTRLEPEEIAKDVNYSNDVIVSNAALIDAPIENARARPFLKLRLTGPLTEAHLFNDERQYLADKDGAYEFSAHLIELDGFVPATLPVHDASVQEWLKPSLFIQSEDPKLIDKAKEIAGDETNALKVSTKLCHWVYENVRTTFSAQLSNTLEVLEHMEGDCTEHSVLFIGLARAAGLPAREVAGLIYVDNGRPGFYFHQWATVWIGKWIDVDPTFNQPLADVTHIKLAEGDLFQQARLIPIIGQIKVQVPENVAPGG
ncbi:MAG TPA: transglutaminase-like domain-containing protein [Candidatus Hydrogenedentes bacterium]|nr:transglutaminase-like domain-containing protein [Candidatus Hydrogenedentota bacterium]